MIESRPNLDGRNMVMMLGPTKNPPPEAAAGESTGEPAAASATESH